MAPFPIVCNTLLNILTFRLLAFRGVAFPLYTRGDLKLNTAAVHKADNRLVNCRLVREADGGELICARDRV